MNATMDVLLWARGPGFVIATAILLFGLTLRLAEILFLGRRPDLAPPRGSAVLGGLKVVVGRMLPAPGMLKQAPVQIIGGYVFHAGFLVALLFFVPHIELFEAGFGLSWPGLPSPVIEAVTVVSMVALLALLATRILDPVRRLLATAEDYLMWGVTILPLLTGYLAVNRLILSYDLMLGLHVLSVELLMVVFPFTRLTHAVTFVLARYYNGWLQGRRGAAT